MVVGGKQVFFAQTAFSQQLGFQRRGEGSDDKWTFHGETHLNMTTQQGKFSLGYLRKYLQCHLPLARLSCKELT